jgi:hypothetical protein
LITFILKEVAHCALAVVQKVLYQKKYGGHAGVIELFVENPVDPTDTMDPMEELTETPNNDDRHECSA